MARFRGPRVSPQAARVLSVVDAGYHRSVQTETKHLEAGIAAIEAQRSTLGDQIVNAMLAAARAKLDALRTAADAGEPQRRLKQVAILFLDVVGSTSLAQHLGPEEIGAVLDGTLRRGVAIVADHGGRTLQFAGDNLLAAFGVDVSREDDSERAVRCGLALLALGRTIGDEVAQRYGREGFGVRVGIHTGEVLLGGDVDAGGTIRGNAVNIAARMEQTAPAGALRISHDTYATIRGLFEVHVQEPLPIRGVEEPVQSYLVVRAKPRSFRIGSRGIEGVATRMIGRDADLAILQRAFETLFEERRLAAISIVADAGIGKSRLLDEFAAWCEARRETFFLFRGRATPQTQEQPFGLLRDILAWRFHITDDDTVDAARRKMEEGIAPFFAPVEGADFAEAQAHLLGHLIGIEWRESRHLRDILDDAQQIRGRAVHAAAELFRRVAVQAGHPVVMQLEDLHWADNDSLDLLDHLTRVDADVPLLVAAFMRPTFFERRTGWCSAAVHRRHDLKALDRSDSRALAAELLKKLPTIPAALGELVVGGSDGNPFYMEELVKMLIDQGAISTGDPWKVDAERLLVTRVPSTLTGVLQARLDSLPAVERATLQSASVIGAVFWDRALLAVDHAAVTTLPALARRSLVSPRVDADDEVDDLREYAFTHAILHQVTYATVLKRRRRDLHGRLARWLAAQTGLRANDFLAAAAWHFEEAGDAANAAEFHLRAAEQARSRMAHDAVLGHVQRALDLLSRTNVADADLLRWRILVAREATLDIQGDRPAQRADIDAMDRLADRLDDARKRAFAAWRRCDLERRMGDYAALEQVGLRAVEQATRAGEDELRLMAQRMVAMARGFQGAFEDGLKLAEQTRIEARARRLIVPEAHCLNLLGILAEALGDSMGFLDYELQALEICRSVGNLRQEAITRSNIGVALVNLGDLVAGHDALTEGLRLIEANGDRAIGDSTLVGLSTVALWQGDPDGALVLARRAVETAVAVQGRDWEAISLLAVGDAELASGALDAAETTFRHAHAIAVEINNRVRHDASAGLARVLMGRGDLAGALEAIAPLLVVGETTGAPVDLDGAIFPRFVELTCHRVLERVGDARATDWLRRAHEGLEATAARIGDAAMRARFLANIPHNREIMRAWEASAR